MATQRGRRHPGFTDKLVPTTLYSQLHFHFLSPWGVGAAGHDGYRLAIKRLTDRAMYSSGLEDLYKDSYIGFISLLTTHFSFEA